MTIADFLISTSELNPHLIVQYQHKNLKINTQEKSNFISLEFATDKQLGLTLHDLQTQLITVNSDQSIIFKTANSSFKPIFGYQLIQNIILLK